MYCTKRLNHFCFYSKAMLRRLCPLAACESHIKSGARWHRGDETAEGHIARRLREWGLFARHRTARPAGQFARQFKHDVYVCICMCATPRESFGGFCGGIFFNHRFKSANYYNLLYKLQIWIAIYFFFYYCVCDTLQLWRTEGVTCLF